MAGNEGKSVNGKIFRRKINKAAKRMVNLFKEETKVGATCAGEKVDKVICNACGLSGLPECRIVLPDESLLNISNERIKS